MWSQSKFFNVATILVNADDFGDDHCEIHILEPSGVMSERSNFQDFVLESGANK